MFSASDGNSILPLLRTSFCDNRTILLPPKQYKTGAVSSRDIRVSCGTVSMSRFSQGKVVEGSLAEIVEGSLVEVMEGSLVEVMEGSLVEVMEGSLVKVMEGSLVKVMEGSLVKGFIRCWLISETTILGAGKFGSGGFVRGIVMCKIPVVFDLARERHERRRNAEQARGTVMARDVTCRIHSNR